VTSLQIPVEATLVPGQSIVSAWANSNIRDAVNFVIAPPLAVVYQASVQSIANGTPTAVTMDSTLADTYGGHSNTTNNSRYVAQVAGWYWVKGNVLWAGNATGNRDVQVYKNGSAYPYNWTAVPAAGTFNEPGVEVGALIFLNVGDYVEIWAGQNSGGALSTAANSAMHVLWAHS
jgi:hypothetical protein